MKRSHGAAAILVGALASVFAAVTPAYAAGGTQEPADCSVTITVGGHYNMTCTGRPAGQQWQIDVNCFPQGLNGSDWDYYGNIVTGNGTSTGLCQLRGVGAFADVRFSNSFLQPPGRQ
jgi:hypothetical protein